MVHPKLLEDETFWRDRYKFFEEKGYILRPRYHPEWKASWISKVNTLPEFCEDSIFQWKRELLDATKTEDGQAVFIKRIDSRTHRDEVRIASRLGSPESQKDKRNHCVPILAVFSDDEDPCYQYIVMPVLRPFNEPDFTSFGEVVDFVNQTLEGLVYMHEQNVTHRDCAAENILMDGSKLYKRGWHPMNTWVAPNGKDELRLSCQRSEVEIKYYFIDFGLSTKFAPERHERLVTGELGRTIAPEQKSGLPYDPFKLDMYYLGYVYQTKIVDVFKGLDILRDVARLMTRPDPEDRPSACEMLNLWEGLRSLPSMPPRRTRLRTTQEEGLMRRIMGVVDTVRGSIGL